MELRFLHNPLRIEKTASILTFDIFLEDIINDRINVLIHIFKQEWEAILDGHLQLFQEVRLVEV